ncbi:MAG: endonuclease/exonuclease/phosphatase family protein [Actinobacteria bacterium]|nr:endonuclease/exonuclease/phosphatase family protein [Actinomycetota bacterium]MCL5445740.1 endonuclease/exonuclease/phosphatase family protein [Actinomycetota bacterium]
MKSTPTNQSVDQDPSKRDSPQKRSVVVATFNVHTGVDGWGRPYDLVGACRKIDADVLILQELWSRDDEAPAADAIATPLGYSVTSVALATGRLTAPNPEADHRWMKRRDLLHLNQAFYLDSPKPLPKRVRDSNRFRSGEPGSWCLAVLSRIPVEKTAVVDLGPVFRDSARRHVILQRVTVDSRAMTVAGVHMSHLSSGSPVHFQRMRRALNEFDPGVPSVVAGDMNLWGPPVEFLLPGWRRAVVAKTWPAWRPHSQVDHILTHGPIAVESGEVLDPLGSDHRAVRATIGFSRPRTG